MRRPEQSVQDILQSGLNPAHVLTELDRRKSGLKRQIDGAHDQLNGDGWHPRALLYRAVGDRPLLGRVVSNWYDVHALEAELQAVSEGIDLATKRRNGELQRDGKRKQLEAFVPIPALPKIDSSQTKPVLSSVKTVEAHRQAIEENKNRKMRIKQNRKQAGNNPADELSIQFHTQVQEEHPSPSTPTNNESCNITGKAQRKEASQPTHAEKLAEIATKQANSMKDRDLSVFREKDTLALLKAYVISPEFADTYKKVWESKHRFDSELLLRNTLKGEIWADLAFLLIAAHAPDGVVPVPEEKLLPLYTSKLFPKHDRGLTEIGREMILGVTPVDAAYVRLNNGRAKIQTGFEFTTNKGKIESGTILRQYRGFTKDKETFPNLFESNAAYQVIMPVEDGDSNEATALQVGEIAELFPSNFPVPITFRQIDEFTTVVLDSTVNTYNQTLLNAYRQQIVMSSAD